MYSSDSCCYNRGKLNIGYIINQAIYIKNITNFGRKIIFSTKLKYVYYKKMLNMNKFFISWLCLKVTLLLAISCSTIHANQSIQKTPDDVYMEALLLAENVKHLRVNAGIKTPWPVITVEEGHEPRHVLQKATEILDKINRYRKNIAKTGEIAVSRFLGRDITPNEVFLAVSHLRSELSLLVNSPTKVIKKNIKTTKGKTPAHVYAKLSEVSIALDESLGLRGISPSEVFIRSQQVLDLAGFLRQSQNLSMSIDLPEKPRGKLPNHALQSVQNLLKKINFSEKNLWMKPIKVSPVPRRVIKPGDVYDAMGVVLAELQRIQYRLGLERHFPELKSVENKTPDDVIFNTVLAQQLLPEFSMERDLQQYDRLSLIKTPSHVYSITEHILYELSYYRKQKGIQVKPKSVPKITGLKPQHVYSKVLESLEKINVLRKKIGLKISAVPDYPLRKITPQEVFDIVLLIDEQLDIIYQHVGISSFYWRNRTNNKEYFNKTPSDVYHNIWKISELLDTILGINSFTPNEVFQKATDIYNDVNIVFNQVSTAPETKIKTKIHSRIVPKDVFKKSEQVLDLVLKAQRRAGMFDVEYIAIPTGPSIKPGDVYNQVRIIEAEITELKVFLGITQSTEKAERVKNKKPVDVYKVLIKVEAKLNSLLHKKAEK